MSFLIRLLGLAMIAASVGIVYKLCEKVIWPYNRFIFEHTNEHGVLIFEAYEEKIAHDKYKAKNQTIEFAIAIPTVPMFGVGLFMVIDIMGNLFLK